MARDRRYRVEAMRSGDWWAITVPQLPGVFSQAKRIDQIAERAREAIALMLDVDEDEVGDIELHVTPPAAAKELLDALRAVSVAADEAATEAARLRRQVAEALRDEGLPMRDVGEFIGVSHQRVSQLLALDG
ncbi:MAG TPA: type II toxin-antitoxin system HicB family antitoxin [Acidimicrobiia bacterium]|jgi:predicted RNase H-like HicB family nuclease